MADEEQIVHLTSVGSLEDKQTDSAEEGEIVDHEDTNK